MGLEVALGGHRVAQLPVRLIEIGLPVATAYLFDQLIGHAVAFNRQRVVGVGLIAGLDVGHECIDVHDRTIGRVLEGNIYGVTHGRPHHPDALNVG